MEYGYPEVRDGDGDDVEEELVVVVEVVDVVDVVVAAAAMGQQCEMHRKGGSSSSGASWGLVDLARDSQRGRERDHGQADGVA